MILDDKNIEINQQILEIETKQFEQEIWDENEFCTCNADSINECSCPPEKKVEFKKKRKQAMQEEFGDRAGLLFLEAGKE